MIKTIDYNEILELFNNKDIYDIGYLKGKELLKIGNFPIKEGIIASFQEKIETIIKNNGILLIILSKENNAAIKNLIKINIPDLCFEETRDFAKKPAMVQAGLTQYAKNQLTYHKKFQFEFSCSTYFIFNNIINLPNQNKPNWNYIELCKNCNDCINSCPAHAIHADDDIPWLDRQACREFCGVGNNEKIISLKYIINEKYNNLLTNEELKHMSTMKQVCKIYPNLKWEGELIIINGEQYYTNSDICRECCSQKKCSQYNGNYSYKKPVLVKKDKIDYELCLYGGNTEK